MSLWCLTKEKKDELLRQKDEKVAELKRLQARTPISLWKEDLDNLLNELNRVSNFLLFLIKKKTFNFYHILYFIVARRKRTERRPEI